MFFAITVLLFFIANGIFVANFVGVHIEQNSIQTFRLWNWIFYFNVGGLVRRYKPRIHCWHIVLLVFVNYSFQYCLTPMMPTIYCEFFYSSIPVMLLSLSLFSYLLNISNNRLQMINGGGKFFLPVYTFHIYIIGKTEGLFEQYVYSLSSYTAPLFWLLVSLLSVILAWIVMKVPYMDKIFRI